MIRHYYLIIDRKTNKWLYTLLREDFKKSTKPYKEIINKLKTKEYIIKVF